MNRTVNLVITGFFVAFSVGLLIAYTANAAKVANALFDTRYYHLDPSDGLGPVTRTVHLIFFSAVIIGVSLGGIGARWQQRHLAFVAGLLLAAVFVTRLAVILGGQHKQFGDSMNLHVPRYNELTVAWDKLLFHAPSETASQILTAASTIILLIMAWIYRFNEEKTLKKSRKMSDTAVKERLNLEDM